MSDSAANIGVIFGGDIGPLKDATKKASSLIGDFSKNALGAGKAIAGMASAGAVAAAGGMAVLTKAAVDNAREIKALANVANTSMERLQRMGYAAGTVNVPLDKLSDIIKDVNDKIGDFTGTEGGALADFFDNIAPKIGMTIADFKKLSGDEALQAYYNALEQANLSQQDMTFYMEAIASDATALIPLLKNNGEQFRTLGDEAQRFGVVMSDIEIAQLEEANRSFDRAGAAIRGAGQDIAVKFSPYVTELTELFLGAGESAGGFGNIATSAFEGAIKTVAFFADAIHGLHVIFKGLHVVVSGVGTVIVGMFNEVVQAAEFVARQVINQFNLMIDGLNMLPFVDIAKIGMPEFGNAMQEITDRAVDNVGQLTSELNELMMTETAGSRVTAVLDEISAKSRQAAADVAAVANTDFESGKSGATIGSKVKEDKRDKEAESAAAKAEAKRQAAEKAAMAYEDQLKAEADMEMRQHEWAVQSIKDRYMTEEELLKQHRETMAIIGEEYDATQFESEAQWRSIREQAQREHADNMQFLREREKVNAVAIAGGMAQDVMSLAQGHSRRAFEMSKKAAKASAVIDGFKSATAAWSAGMATGGPWAPLVAASYVTASLAKTGALIRGINSQSYSGGGDGGGNVGGSGVPASIGGIAAGGQTGTTASAPAAQQSATISISDGYLDASRLVKILQEAKANGITDFNFMMA